MTNGEQSTPDLSPLMEMDLDTDALFEVLSDPARRFVVACLHEYANPMALADVADELAVWKYDTEITDIPADEVKSIYITLYHAHIPKMADAGIVKYSQERDAVALAEIGEEISAHMTLPPVNRSASHG